MAAVESATEQRASKQRPALTDGDRVILEQLPQALCNGLELYRWWEDTHARNGYRDRIPLALQPHRPTDVNFGFLENVPLSQGILPVLGVYQGQFYDGPKAPESQQKTDAQWWRRQVEEYMLGYFMRVSSSVKPQPVPQGGQSPPGWLKDLSLCGGGRPEPLGWTYRQYLYKLKESGEVGKFPDKEQRKIVDLRKVGSKYEWIVFKIAINDFQMQLHLNGANGPMLELPLQESVYTVITRDFVVNRERPRPGVLAEYGYAYAVIPDPRVKSLLAYGPSELTSTFDSIQLRVLENGQVYASSAFVAQQPTRLVNFDPVQLGFRFADMLSFNAASRLMAPFKRALEGAVPQLDPVFLAVRMANLLSANLAAEEWCISKERLLNDFMTLHFIETYQLLLGTVSQWKMVPDWTDKENLPGWALTGMPSA